MWRPPALTAPVEGQDELALTTKPSGAADGGWTRGADSLLGDIISFPLSLSPDQFPRHGIQGACQPFPSQKENENNRLGGYMNLNCLADSKNDPNFINVKTEVCEFQRESEMSLPEASMRELCYGIDGNNAAAADSLMSTAVSSTDYCKSEVHMNFMPPRGETATGYPMKAHGAEARGNRISRSQKSGKFSSPECSTSVMPLADNLGVKGNNFDINVVPLPFGYPQQVDGNFLTLGIGGGTEIRSNSNFSTREIASKLEDAVSSQCNSSLVGQSPKNPLSLAQLKGRAARIETNAGVLASSASNLVGRMYTSGEGGLIRDTSARLNSIPFPSLQTPQANVRSNFSETYDTSMFDLTPSSLPFGSTLISQPGCVTSSQLGPEITKSTYFSSQPTWLQDYHRNSSMNVSPEYSTNYPSNRHRGSSISHAQLGNLIPLTEGRGIQISDDVLFPVSVQPVGNLTPLTDVTRAEVAKIGSYQSSVQPVGQSYASHNVSSTEALGNSLFPERIGFPISKDSTFQSAADGPFPKRLGVQPNDFANARTTRGNLHQTQNSGLVDYFQKPVRPPFATGPPPIHLGAQVNLFRPSVTSGQYQHGVPAQLTKDKPRADYSNGQVIPVAKHVRPQASPIVSHPSLKRPATENSRTAHLGQRRKIFPQPVVHHPIHHQRQSIPAIPARIPATVHDPAAPLHVKWQGFEGPPRSTGQKCLLCKRDLSFTSEGPVYQPAIPPAVAVLPCGHSFHDHCLQLITPGDQSKNPPCIPCAVGET